MNRSALAIIYLTVFVDLVGFGIVLPQLPFYVRELGASGIGVGATLTAYSGAQFIASPILGRLSDRVGRRPVILFSLLGTAISLTVSGFAAALWLLIASRALAGLFGGSVGPAQAYIADSTTPRQRARYMGGIGAAIGLGLVVGPAIGAVLSPLGFGTAAFAAAGLAFANFIFGWFRLPESHHLRTRRTRFSVAWVAEAVRRPNMGQLLAATFLMMFAFVGLEATFALFGEERYALTPLGLGIILSYVGVLVTVTQVTLVGPINARLGEQRLALVGAVLIGLSLGALPLAPHLWMAASLVATAAIGQGFVHPAIATLNSLLADPRAQGGALGLGQSAASLARVIGPVSAGALFDVGSGWSYYVGALSVAAGFLLMAMMRRVPHSRSSEARIAEALGGPEGAQDAE